MTGVQSFNLRSSNATVQLAKFFLLLCVTFTFNACVFEDFDEPPVAGLPDLRGNTTIADLKALHPLGSPTTALGSEMVLEATVIGNDATGNIFKELYLQDATGGLTIRLDEVGLNGLYPVGTPVVVRLANLYIGDFSGNYQITADVDNNRIAAALVRDVVFASGDPVELTPMLITIDQLADNAFFQENLATLVTLENLQFSGGDAGASYADAANQQSLNRTLVDCDGETIIIRTSGFADFAAELTPTGNGSVVAILTAFNETRQLVLRTPDDLDMEAERCGVSTGGDLITIAELRALFTGSATNIPDDTKIRGVVISDFNSNTINGQNLFLQDGNAGIVIRFESFHSFPIGTDLEVTVSNLQLTEFNGLLQVSGVPFGNTISQGVIPTPTPREVTIGEILANFDDYESTLVKFVDATVSGGPTYGDGLTVNDGTGSLEIFTLFAAPFSGDNAPLGMADVTAIVSEFNNPQLIIRYASDVDGDGGMSGDETEITAGELRTLFLGGSGNVPADKFIEGVIISDIPGGNINNRNLIIQTDDGAGIVIRMGAAISLPLYQSVRISIGGQALSEFNDVLQVDGVPNTNLMDLGPGNAPEPVEVTLAEIMANGEAYESILVQVEDASFSVGTFPENSEITMTDGTGSISGFIRMASSLAGSATPSGTFTATFTVTQFDGPYDALFRNINDFE